MKKYPPDRMVINEFYTRYKKFVNDDTLPQFDIVTFDISKYKNGIMAEVEPPIASNRKFTLHIVKNFQFIYKGNIAKLLYHEFTHIFDMCKYFKNVYGKDKSKLLEVYSEVNASFISLMISYKFKNILDIKSISLGDEFSYYNKKVTLEDYLKYYFLEIVKCQEVAITYPSPENIEKVLKHTLYYFGYIKFCKRFCIDNFEDHLKLDEFKSYFGFDIIMLFNFLNNDNYITEDLILELSELRKFIFVSTCHKLNI